jgi:hypothetical protein
MMGRMEGMPKSGKSFLDRILRAEGAIAFIQQIDNAIGYAVGGGIAKVSG